MPKSPKKKKAPARTMKARLEKAAQKVLQMPGASKKFNIARALAGIEEEVFNEFLNVIRNGKGITKVTALKEVKNWMQETVVAEQEEAVIVFSPIGNEVGDSEIA